MGLVLDHVLNEVGVMEAGYVIADNSPFKELVVSSVTGTGMQTKILKNEKQLRSGQGPDTLSWCHKKFETSQPKVLQSLSNVEVPPTPEVLAKRVEEARARPVEVAEPDANARVQQPDPAPQHEQLDEVDSGEELDPVDLLHGSAVAASAKGGGKAGKGGGKGGKGKGEARERKRLRGTSAPVRGQPQLQPQLQQQLQQQQLQQAGEASGSARPPTAILTAEALPRGPPLPQQSAGSEVGTHRSRSPVARSVCSAATSKGNGKKQSLESQFQKYMKEIDLCKIVVGSKEGDVLNWARRVADALDKKSRG